MKAAARHVERHHFSSEIRNAVRALHTLDNWHGPLELIEHWGVIAIAAGTSFWAWKNVPTGLAVPIFMLAVYVIGARQRALAGVLHQACHGTLMANRRMGCILGTLLGGYPVLQSYTGYRDSHVRAHHGAFGDPCRDPDYQFFRRADLYGKRAGRATLRRYLLGSLSPRATARYVGFLLRHRILTENERPAETLLRISIYVAVAVAAVAFGQLWVLLGYWVLPLVTTQAWIGAFAELLEHYPLMERESRRDIHMSNNREFGRVWDIVLGEKRGEGYHLVHHLFPRVPIWRLQEVHEILQRDPAYARLTVASTPAEALRSITAALPP